MHRTRHFSASLALGALMVAAGLMASPAMAATTTGTWVQYPTGAAEYQAEVQQPINTANTSNWSSKSKGAIPVMFKLSSRPGHAAFESIWSDQPNTANDYAFMSFTPSTSMTFAQITNLSTNYNFTLGNCHGGSLRWQVRTSPTQAVFIYYGDLPNFTECTGASSQSGVNMINQPDLRYDTSQYVGGTFYDTYANAVLLTGATPIMRASLVIDSGWQNAPNGDQRLDVSNTTVNDNAYQFVSSAGGGSFAPTCVLPAATIEVTKLTPNYDGSINEDAVQAPADGGNAFRVVDCKYQYVLSIPSLLGSGKYQVEILIDGVSVPTPASPGGQVKFDLK